VHGILWVLDEIVAGGLISEKEAMDKLMQLIDLNPRRMPRDEKHRKTVYKARQRRTHSRGTAKRPWLGW
jgi:hypothetical protein